MENMGLWVTLIIIIFVLGSIFNLRTSPREKALANLRENARKMGLNPRLVPAPEWLKLEKNGQYAQMVAYYSLIIADGTLPLIRAIVENQQLKSIQINQHVQNYPIQITGVYGVEMQANHVGVYWNESTDLKGEQLSKLHDFLQELVTIVDSSKKKAHSQSQVQTMSSNSVHHQNCADDGGCDG